MSSIALSKPTVLGGVERAEIEIDLDKLTGADVEFAARQATLAAGQQIPVLVLDLGFHLQIAARASGIEASEIRKLPAVDYLAITTKVQGFLFGSG